MSFGQFKGKLVWGSSVFRILLETENKRLKSDFNGDLILFERRHEKSKLEFNNLDEFLSGIKKLWQSSLSMATIQDTRIARWIEEYFGELGIQVRYQEIIDALRGQYEEVKPIKVSPEEIIHDVKIVQFIQDSDSIQTKGIRRTIQGDLNDEEEMEQLLDHYLLENKQVRKNKAKSSISYKLADGLVNNYDQEIKIIDNPLSTDLLLTSRFVNNLDQTVTELTIKDIIPYDFEILDVKTNGNNVNREKKEKTEEGLSVNWKIPKLDLNEEVNIEYILAKRMLRTILIRDDNDITLLHTYQDIDNQGDDIFVESKFTFTDKTQIIENVKILDQIPSDLKLQSSQPDAIPPLGKINLGMKETEITWSYTNVPSQTQFLVVYDLVKNPRLFRDIINLMDEKDETVAEIVKIIKPLSNNSGYGVIFAIKAYQTIPSDLTIQDVIPIEFEINEVHLDLGSISQTINSDLRTINWKIEEIPVKQTFSAYLKYIGDSKCELKGFSIQSGAKSVFTNLGDAGMTIHKREKIIMPSIYQDDLDN